MTTNTNAALREKLIDMIAEHLSGTYRCLRVWEAWNFGTMIQDDFDDVGESDTPAELVDAILAALATAAAAVPAAQGDAEDAARWRETLMHVGAAYHLGGQHFTLNTLRITDQMFLLRGSVAQHFAKCIDASRAARSQAKQGGA